MYIDTLHFMLTTSHDANRQGSKKWLSSVFANNNPAAGEQFCFCFMQLH